MARPTSRSDSRVCSIEGKGLVLSFIIIYQIEKNDTEIIFREKLFFFFI